MGAVGGATSVYGPSANGLATLATQLDQIDVIINGKTQRMFALGLKQTYPPGTCTETLISSPSVVVPPGQCTAPPFAFALILWQSHAATAAPDRMALIVGDTGPINFAQTSPASGVIPAFALYMEGENNLWDSKSGTLTSNVTATNQACGVPLPPFAKTGSCSVANFDEQGTIIFEPFWGTDELKLEIPRQNVRGIWQTITETQTIMVGAPWDYSRAIASTGASSAALRAG
jgi:hypothetical protein